MQSLGVSCKSCGTMIRTGIVMGLYGRPVLGSMAWSCPCCLSRASYTSADYVALAG